MKTIQFTLAAVSALAMATPLAAQAWQGDRAVARPPSQSWSGDRQGSAGLRMQLDTGIARGTITRREATMLRVDLNALVRLERQYGRDGFSRAERNTLARRGAGLERMILRAEGNGSRGAPRAGWNEDRGTDLAARIDMDAGHRGDRFSGDLRVGQHVSDRQVALPIRYRTRYQDDARAYYRYDANRVYRIDRSSGLILAMFDVSN